MALVHMPRCDSILSKWLLNELLVVLILYYIQQMLCRQSPVGIAAKSIKWIAAKAINRIAEKAVKRIAEKAVKWIAEKKTIKWLWDD